MPLLVLLLAFFVLSACEPVIAPGETPPLAGQAAADLPPCSEEWTAVTDGIRYRQHGCDPDSGEFDLHLVEVDPAVRRLEARSGAATTAPSLARELDVPFAINANFFDENLRPLGIIIEEGEQRQAPTDVSWASIFWTDTTGRPEITTSDAWPPQRTPHTAVQAGPRLVINGRRNEVAQATPSLRSGVCIQRDRRLLFFVTPTIRFFDVHEMVALAAQAADSGGLGCRNAMLFDGGPSAQLYVRRPGAAISMDGDRVPVLLYAR
jgi:uncharacterized protein YigE (DUF2233 family)